MKSVLTYVRVRRNCTIPDCGQKAHGKGLCMKHYKRLRDYGDPFHARPRKSGRKWEAHGYEMVRVAGHVLAKGRKNPIVGAHRLVLFNKIGPGEHSCAGCGCPLSWEDDTLCVNHLNEDKLDNRPDNLVPMCRECNILYTALKRQEDRRKQHKFISL